MQFEIPEEKIGKFFQILHQVKFQAVMPVKLLAKFLGLLDSFSRALGQIVRLMTRSLYACLHLAYFSKEGWGAFTSHNESAKE